MALRYCLKCDDIREESRSLQVSGAFFCVTCRKKLMYFGRESGAISSEKIMAEYDALHPFSPREDFTGYFQQYSGGQVNISVLDCEDTLLHDPSNADALRFLSKHYWMLGEAKKANDYMQQLITYHDLGQSDVYHYATLLLTLKAYNKLFAILKQYRFQLPSFYVYHMRALVHLGKQQFRKALPCFYRALQEAEESQVKDSMITVIRQITAYLEREKEK